MSTRSRSKKVNRAWLHDHLNDPYVKLAQKERFRSRAAFKLKELDEMLLLVKPGQLVIDLGAAPGAWSQYVSRRLNLLRPARGAESASMSTSRVVALDMLAMEPIEGVQFVHGDFRDSAVLEELRSTIAGRPVDLIISDLAPNLSGVAEADAARMSDLVELAIEFAMDHLRPQGALVCKAFHGRGYSQLAMRFKTTFRVFRTIKPKASRDKSAETYLVGIGPKDAVRRDKDCR